MTPPLLELSGLACERDGRQLFASLSATIGPGDVVQIAGPNGTGKTSLLRILTGLSREYEGDIHWDGRPLRRQWYEYRNQLLYIGHTPAVKRTLTPAENLHWYASLYAGRPQFTVSESLSEVGLSGFEEVFCYQLSAGQLRRVALARLFLTPAPIWVLDEPFTAIDQEGVEKLQARIREHVDGGGRVILTTHQALGMDGVKYLNLQDYMVSNDFA